MRVHIYADMHIYLYAYICMCIHTYKNVQVCWKWINQIQRIILILEPETLYIYLYFSLVCHYHFTNTTPQKSVETDPNDAALTGIFLNG